MTDPDEIVARRVFAVPRAEVFRAFADPERYRVCWGPAGFTNTPNQSADACAELRGVCVPANEQNFDRLAAHLAGGG